jgi:hypothetical protein
MGAGLSRRLLCCRYMVIVTIVGLMEMGGYACRISMFNKAQYGAYVAMQCLLIIPPSFLALVQVKFPNGIGRAQFLHMMTCKYNVVWVLLRSLSAHL